MSIIHVFQNQPWIKLYQEKITMKNEIYLNVALATESNEERGEKAWRNLIAVKIDNMSLNQDFM